MADHALLPSTDRALTRRVAVEQAERRAPSLVAAVVRDGRLVWTGGRGRVGGSPPTADTQYRIGSISKTFTAVLVLRLRDEGRLDLSDPLEAHLPGTPVGDRTIAQLLSHASGLTAEPPGPWWERTPGRPWPDLAGSLDQTTVRHRAGRRFHYSNLGFAVLGELVARMRGTSWTAALRREILEPLGMTRTTPLPEAPHARGFAVHPWADVLLPEPAHDAVAMAPAGQLWSTVTDLGRWVAFCSGEGGEVLRADTISEMREPLVRDADVETVGYGLGLELRYHRGRRLVGHGGSMPGFLAALWVEGDDPTGVVFLANTTSGLNPTITQDLLDIMAEHQPRLPAEWAPLDEVDPELLALTGLWYWGPAPFTLRLRSDRWLDLTAMQGGVRASRFRPEPDGTWTGLDGYYAGETLRIVRRPDGTASHLDLNTFVLTRTPYDPGAPIPGGVDPAGWRGPGPDAGARAEGAAG
jgi:CubicO group peptidase (beta-lactamase class C family)